MPKQTRSIRLHALVDADDELICPRRQMNLVRWLMRERLVLKKFTPLLIVAAIYFAVAPLLPEGAVGPWGLIHLRRFAKFVAALITIQVLGQVAVDLLGERRGTMWSGFFAGFVSSTGVFLTLPDKIKTSPRSFFYVGAAGLLAIVAMLVELLVILVLVAPELFSSIVWAILAMIVTLLAFVWRFSRLREADGPAQLDIVQPGPSSSIDVRAIAKLSGLIFLVLIAVSISNRFLGGSAASVAVFLAGLFELHAVTYSTAELFTQNELTHDAAIFNIALAIAAACISKGAILLFLDHARFASIMFGILTLMLAVGAVAFFLQHQLI